MGKITHAESWRIIESRWCPHCHKHTLTNKHETGLSGIVFRSCTYCNFQFHANYNAKAEESRDFDDNHLKAPDVYCPVCNSVSEWEEVHGLWYDDGADMCKMCQTVFVPDRFLPRTVILICDEMHHLW